MLYFRGESVDEVSFIISGSLEVIQDDEVRDAEITSASERWPGQGHMTFLVGMIVVVVLSILAVMVHREMTCHRHHHRQKTMFI